jgi:diadenosine tetraphosphate (Ap4A) HIT family hydrolase
MVLAVQSVTALAPAAASTVADPTRADAPSQAATPARAPDAVGSRAIATTPLPNLLADWKHAVVDAAIFEAAYATFAHVVDAAIDAEETKQGRKLKGWEKSDIAQPIIDARLPGLRPQFTQQLAATPALRAKTYADALTAYRPIVAKLKDPFTPIAQRDPQARAKETVLWENANVMVLVDKFSGNPHLLVIPKTQVSFPADASAALLAELARVSAIVGDAMMAAASSAKPADIWVNAPQNLHVRQLHVHVDASLPSWEDVAPTEAAQKTAELLYMNEVRRRLAQKLGPTS